MVIEHGEHKGLVISMTQINQSIFNFVLEKTDGVVVSFLGDIYDMRILDCPANEMFLENIKKDS